MTICIIMHNMIIEDEHNINVRIEEWMEVVGIRPNWVRKRIRRPK